MKVELGIVEAYYGTPWSWDERLATATFLASHGYRFFLYAPKADAWLRRRWRETPPPSHTDALADFARRCRALGMRVGVGLSPYAIHQAFDAEARARLADTLAWLDGRYAITSAEVEAS